MSWNFRNKRNVYDFEFLDRWGGEMIIDAMQDDADIKHRFRDLK